MLQDIISTKSKQCLVQSPEYDYSLYLSVILIVKLPLIERIDWEDFVFSDSSAILSILYVSALYTFS